MQFMDVMAPLAALASLHIIRHPIAVQRLNIQYEANAQFTDPEGMEVWVILESATSGSWTRAVGVRSECVTTRPPALHRAVQWQYIDKLSNRHSAESYFNYNQSPSFINLQSN